MKVIVVAGTQAGSGKTTVAVGLMAALRQRGLRVQAFKVGPDPLDPLLHEAATGRPSYTLDGWMLSREYNLTRVARVADSADIAVVEGGETLFDGPDGDERGSAAHVAKTLGAAAWKRIFHAYEAEVGDSFHAVMRDAGLHLLGESQLHGGVHGDGV